MMITRHVPNLIESLETRRLLSGYFVESDSFDDIDLVPGVDAELLNHTDDGWAMLDLRTLAGGPWYFRFYGQNYQELFVSANGLITFGTGSTASNNTDLTASPAQPTVAVLWDDWDTSIGTGSSVLYRMDTDREELIIEWNNVTHVDIGGNNGVTFHATLDLDDGPGSGSNDKVEIHYKDLLVGNPAYDNGASATVGVKAAGTQGDDRLVLGFNGVGPHVNLITSNQGLEIDDKSSLPPLQYLTSSFGYQTAPHSLTMQFSRPVTNVEITDLTVQAQGGGAPFNPEDVLGIGTSAITFTFAGVLPEDRYTATIPAGAITDTSGTPLPGAAVANFLFFVGDANNDGLVNLADFNVLAANFGQTGRNFSQGNFNYDNIVNLADFNLLAARFGQSIAPATTATGPFGDDRIGAGEDDDRDAGHRSVLA